MPTIFFLLPSPSQSKYFHFPKIFLSFLLPSDLRPHISLSVLRSNLCLLFLPGLIPNVFLRQIISSFIKRPNDFPQKIPLPFLPRLLLEPLNLLHYKMSYVHGIVSESVVPDLKIIWLIHRKQIERNLTSLKSFVLVMCPVAHRS